MSDSGLAILIMVRSVPNPNVIFTLLDHLTHRSYTYRFSHKRKISMVGTFLLEDFIKYMKNCIISNKKKYLTVNLINHLLIISAWNIGTS